MSIAAQLDSSIDTTSKMAAFKALNHARQVSDENEALYTDTQKQSAQRIQSYVSSVFPAHRVYLNYRKKFIAVKVEGITMAEAQSTQSQLLEDLCELSNVDVVAHGTNVIFRIAR
jgi:hypothetical protein